ncbi:acyltransferase [Hymenobacter sp. GOD-10R]|uniref:acyltransferase family protein n=1 Tax=Hymenobacter sp. GOD-10R TaxID=3093922 RepID=UPI002D78B7D2|nr:acyltransferase [Hymenobacter sp. GOD-10R]WRQ27119.1 acyltransferase [Hymenobacter sp. GOD-10R]
MTQTASLPADQETTPYFGILDGLRGIAAVAVVVFHFMEFAVPDYADNFIAHAYFAVDFFFCLSGFVIACAYDTRLEKIGVASFLMRRLIRLHPLVVIGSFLGLLTFRLDPFSNLYTAYASKVLPLFVASCLLIPYPLVPERYFNLFHLNPPTWSLFWEYVANFVYAVVLVRMRPSTLHVLTVLAAMALCYEAYAATNLAVGWGGDNVGGGAVRVSYSFLVGIVVYRAKWIIPTRLGFLALTLLLMAAFLLPFSKQVNWLIDSVVVLFYFPLLVALGAGARLTIRAAKLCTFLGAISYPLYMIHYPFLWVFLSYIEKQKPPLSTLAMLIPLGVLLLLLLAYGIMRFVDTPLRAYLSKKLKTGSAEVSYFRVKQ